MICHLPLRRTRSHSLKVGILSRLIAQNLYVISPHCVDSLRLIIVLSYEMVELRDVVSRDSSRVRTGDLRMKCACGE